MVHLVEGSRSIERWRPARSQSRSVIAAVVLVGLTFAAVVLANGVLPSQGVGLDSLWAAVAAIATFGILSRLRGSRFSRASTGGLAGDAPIVIRRSGVAAQSDARRHRRFVPARRATTLHTHDGRQIAARIVDISIAGVAVEARLSDLDFVAVNRVGAQAAGPVRRTPTGAVFGFDTLLDPQPFDASFVL